MAQAHPPPPGAFVQPNFLPVLEAIDDVPFPISKRELLDALGESTVILDGQNISLHDLIKDIHDDHFDNEDELLGALESHYTAAGDAEANTTTLARLPEDAPELVQSMQRLGDASPGALLGQEARDDAKRDPP